MTRFRIFNVGGRYGELHKTIDDFFNTHNIIKWDTFLGDSNYIGAYLLVEYEEVTAKN